MPGISEHPTPESPYPDEYKILSEDDVGDPRDMTLEYIRTTARHHLDEYEQEFEDLTTIDALEERKNELREFFLDAIGGLPERTPLSPSVTGRVSKDRFSVETVLFESRPDFPVTANLFLPDWDRFEPPVPGVVIPCGHSSVGKLTPAYQKAAALLATNGIAALVFDPVGQGERSQSDVTKSLSSATDPHNRLNTGEILLGRNVARTHLWDGIRALDYLETRPEINSDRLGVAGNSGGGNQTAYLAAVDDRLAAAATIGYIKSYESRTFDGKVASCSESNIHRQAAVGCFDQEYLLLAAPTPTLVGVARHDQHFSSTGTWDTFRSAKRLYGILGIPERLSIVESETNHGYYQSLREATAQWMVRWLRGEEISISEPDDLSILDESETHATPNGSVLELDGTRCVYDFCRAVERNHAKKRKSNWENSRPDCIAKVREIAQIRSLDALGVPSATHMWTDKHGDYRVEAWALEPQDGITLPTLEFIPEDPTSDSPLLWLDEEGKHAPADGGAIEEVLNRGRTVVSVDVRGTGETAQDRYDNYDGRFGTDWREMYGASMLGLSPVGMRAEDVLSTALWIRSKQERDQIGLRARGHMTIPALHAAAVENELFEDVTLADRPDPWPVVVGDPSAFEIGSLVYQALEFYDRSDLVETLRQSETVLRIAD